MICVSDFISFELQKAFLWEFFIVNLVRTARDLRFLSKIYPLSGPSNITVKMKFFILKHFPPPDDICCPLKNCNNSQYQPLPPHNGIPKLFSCLFLWEREKPWKILFRKTFFLAFNFDIHEMLFYAFFSAGYLLSISRLHRPISHEQITLNAWCGYLGRPNIYDDWIVEWVIFHS